MLINDIYVKIYVLDFLIYLPIVPEASLPP